MLDYKLIVTERQFGYFYAQEECAVARLAINLMAIKTENWIKDTCLGKVSYSERQSPLLNNV